MANPIPYNQLFDIDGLKLAIQQAEAASTEFNIEATEGFKRTQTSVSALKKELADINSLMNGKTIVLADEKGQQEVVKFAENVGRLTGQIKNNKKELDATTQSIKQNQLAISDAKKQQAELTLELKKGQIVNQEQRLEIGKRTLAMKELALANKEAAEAQKLLNEQARKTQFSDSAAEVRAYQVSVGSGNGPVASSGQSALLKQFKADLDSGKISIVEYNQALDAMAEQQAFFAKQTAVADVAIEEQMGLLLNLNTELKLLQKQKLNIADPAQLAKQNALIQETEAEIAKLNNAGKVGFDNMGNAVEDTAKKTGKFEAAISRATNLSNIGARAVTQLTRQLVGLGVGFLSFAIGAKAVEAIVTWVQNLDYFSGRLDQAKHNLEALNAVMADADKEAGKESANLNILYKAATDVNNSMENRLAAVRELQKEFPETFANLSQEAILTGQAKVGYDELTSSLLENAKARAALSKITDLQGKMLDADFEKAKIRNARMNQLAAVKAPTEEEVQAEARSGGGSNSSLKDRIAFINKQADAAQHIVDQNKKVMQGQIDFLTSFAGGTNKMAESITKSYKEIADAQLTSIEQIKDRIAELSKLPDSATKGSPIELRIEALKARLKELTGHLKAAKDGFQILEDQINKTLLKLQDAIVKDFTEHQGRQTKQTIALADAYERLVARLADYKKAQQEAIIESNRQHNIKTFGSVFPGANSGNQVPSLSGQDQKKLTIADNVSGIEKNDIELNNVIEKYNEANNAIIALYEKRAIAKEEMDKRLTNSAKLQANEEYRINLDSLNKLLENAKLTYGIDSKQYSDLLVRKSNLTKAFNDGRLKEFISELEAERKKMEDFYKSLEDTIGKGADIVGEATGNRGVSSLLSDAGKGMAKLSLSQQTGEDPVSDAQKFQMGAQIAIDATQAYTDFAIEASKQRQAALEKEMQYEIQGAGNNKEAKLRIEAEYNKRIADEKRKQAKTQKAAAAVEIILNTAIAISKTLAETAIFGIPLIPIIAALGAVELGIVLAQPLPQFAKGREDGPATFAEVNERGPEALVKGNRMRFANKGKRGVTFLDKGEKVITADKTAQMLNRQIAYQNDAAENVNQSRVIYDRYISTSTQRDSFDYDRMAGAVQDGMSKLPIEQNIWDERGHAHYRRTANARIKSVRDRNRL